MSSTALGTARAAVRSRRGADPRTAAWVLAIAGLAVVARLRLLREAGPAAVVPRILGPRAPVGAASDAYVWCAPLVGGCAVGARAARYDLLGVRLRPLSRPGAGDRHPGRRSLEPGRTATVAVYRDRLLARTVALIDFHLVSGVQAHGSYRADRPLLVARHRREVLALERLVHEQLDDGHLVHAAGDSNLDGLRLPGLTSAWQDRPGDPGTLGAHRKVDDVHGPGPAADVRRVVSASDHAAIVVRRASPGGG